MPEKQFSDSIHGAASLSYNSPAFLAERLHIDDALRAPFDAVESIVAGAVDETR